MSAEKNLNLQSRLSPFSFVGTKLLTRAGVLACYQAAFTNINNALATYTNRFRAYKIYKATHKMNKVVYTQSIK